jgi:hypothetical protein
VAKAKAQKKKRALAGRFIRLLLRLGKGLILAVLLAAVWSAGFIWLKCYSSSPSQRAVAAPLERDTTLPAGYTREEASTYLTLPEWYIVYNTDEYAHALTTRAPSAFPYAGSITQYWRYYGSACAATRGVYPFSRGNHLMLAVIGSSFSIEYALKGAYENSIGRLTEWISGYDTPEDAFARATATEYGTFMHTVPWYEFPFAQKLKALWTTTPSSGPHMFRKWERRMALSLEYGVKALYGRLIGGGSHATYGQEQLTIDARIRGAGPEVFADGAVKKVKDVGGDVIVTIPRYEAFTARVSKMIAQNVRFVDIAGNDEILVTVIAPAGWSAPDASGPVVLDERLLTDVAMRRVGLKLPVASLHAVLSKLQSSGAKVEHLYDY